MGEKLAGVVLTYDADMNFRARLPLFRDIGVGDTVRYAARGEYVVFKIEEVEGEKRFHAIEPEGWNDDIAKHS